MTRDLQNELDGELCKAVSFIHARGWCPGTGGNFSHVLKRDPLRLRITASGIDKGSVTPADLLTVNEAGSVIEGASKPSAETLLHIVIGESTNARCILHTHSTSNTVLSMLSDSSFTLSGLEMLKGISGVSSHEDSVFIPVFQNSQDMRSLSEAVRGSISERPDARGFLLQGHGLYTWGESIAEARRHVEVFEFLFETVIRLKELGAADGILTYSR